MKYYSLPGYSNWQRSSGKRSARWASVAINVLQDDRVADLSLVDQLGWIMVILAARYYDNRIPASVAGQPVEKAIRRKLNFRPRRGWSLEFYARLGLVEVSEGEEVVLDDDGDDKPEPQELRLVPPPAKKRKPATGLPSRFGDIWKKYMGTANYGRIGNALKEFDTGKSDWLIAELESYLNTLKPEDVQWASPEKFMAIANAKLRQKSKAPTTVDTGLDHAELLADIKRLAR